MSRSKTVAPAIVLTASERLALDTFMGAKRKWYTAKRIASISGLTVKQVAQAFDRFVSLDLMWLSDYKTGGVENRYAMSDEGVEFHETLGKAAKVKAVKAATPEARTVLDAVAPADRAKLLKAVERARKALEKAVAAAA